MTVIDMRTERALVAPKGSVVSIGFFDGVHRGHRHLLSLAKQYAEKRGLPLLVFSFFGEGGPKRGDRLQSDKERAAALYEAGADTVAFADFSSLCALSPRTFVGEVLLAYCRAEAAFTGENFRFGKGASGDAPLLSLLMKEEKKEAFAVPSLAFEGEPISSALIKAALSAGDCGRAEGMLGHPYTLTLPVSRGDGRGAGLSFPTANQRHRAGCFFPKEGVYITLCRVGEEKKSYLGITDIGFRPTFAGEEKRIETHLLDFRGDLYGKDLSVAFCRFIRNEEKFASREALIERLYRDEEEARIWKSLNGIS